MEPGRSLVDGYDKTKLSAAMRGGHGGGAKDRDEPLTFIANNIAAKSLFDTVI